MAYIFILCASRGPRPLHHSAKVLSVSLCSKWTKVGNSLHTVSLLRQETLGWSLQVFCQEPNIEHLLNNGISCPFPPFFYQSKFFKKARCRVPHFWRVRFVLILMVKLWSRLVLHCNPFSICCWWFWIWKICPTVWPTWNNEHELLPIRAPATKRNSLFNWSQSLYISLEFQYNHLPNSSSPPLI